MKQKKRISVPFKTPCVLKIPISQKRLWSSSQDTVQWLSLFSLIQFPKDGCVEVFETSNNAFETSNNAFETPHNALETPNNALEAFTPG